MTLADELRKLGTDYRNSEEPLDARTVRDDLHALADRLEDWECGTFSEAADRYVDTLLDPEASPGAKISAGGFLRGYGRVLDSVLGLR